MSCLVLSGDSKYINQTLDSIKILSSPGLAIDACAHLCRITHLNKAMGKPSVRSENLNAITRSALAALKKDKTSSEEAFHYLNAKLNQLDAKISTIYSCSSQEKVKDVALLILKDASSIINSP